MKGQLYQSTHGSNSQAVLKRLGFTWQEAEAEAVSTIHPPQGVDDPNVRSFMIRAWIEVSAFVAVTRMEGVLSVSYANCQIKFGVAERFFQ